MGGGAWPFLVGGVICLVNSDNERDLNLLNSYANSTVFSPFISVGGGDPWWFGGQLLRGTVGV